MRRTTLMLVLGLLAGCTSWQPVEGLTPKQFISREHPSVVRVQTRVEYTRSHAYYYGFLLENPTITGERLFGTRDRLPVSLPLYEVQAIHVRQFDGTKTSGILAGLLFLGGVFACTSGNC